jgi:peptidoglycan hydrolase-like protein with peptidoglycan-binding domain
MSKKIFIATILAGMLLTSSASAQTITNVLKYKKDLEKRLVQLKGKQGAAAIMSQTNVPKDPVKSTINLQKEVSSIEQAANASKPKPTVNSSKYNFGTSTLTTGSSGAAVVELQKFLGVSPVNGYFGPATKAKLMEWQKSVGIDPVGVFGPSSRAKAYSLSK